MLGLWNSSNKYVLDFFLPLIYVFLENPLCPMLFPFFLWLCVLPRKQTGLVLFISYLSENTKQETRLLFDFVALSAKSAAGV